MHHSMSMTFYINKYIIYVLFQKRIDPINLIFRIGLSERQSQPTDWIICFFYRGLELIYSMVELNEYQVKICTIH